jgi:hypothetical protein
VPKLQFVNGVVYFLRQHRGHQFASSALLEPINRSFVAGMHRFAKDQGVPMVEFVIGQRKDDVAQAFLANLDLSVTGPAVVEAPGGVIGFIMSGWQQPLEEVGLLGPDKGEGGPFLLVPPGYDDEVPEGYFVVRSDTFLVNLCLRGFAEGGKPEKAVSSLKKMRVYRLTDRAAPPTMTAVDLSGAPVTMIPLGESLDGIGYFELLSRFIEREPVREQDKQFLGLAQSLGIGKGVPFAPGQRMCEILTRAAQTGHAMVAALSQRKRRMHALRCVRGVEGVIDP